MSDTDDPGVEAAVVQLGRWASAAKAVDAADQRVRDHRVRQQAEDEATLASLLAGLAERRASIAIHGRTGTTMRGTVVGVGADFVAVAHGGQLTLVAIAAIDWVRPDGPSRPAAFGDRPSSGGRLVAVLAGLAEDVAQLRIVSGGETIVGELVAVGEDVLSVRPAGAPADQLLYVPVASVSEASLRLSG